MRIVSFLRYVLMFASCSYRHRVHIVPKLPYVFFHVKEMFLRKGGGERFLLFGRYRTGKIGLIVRAKTHSPFGLFEENIPRFIRSGKIKHYFFCFFGGFLLRFTGFPFLSTSTSAK